MISHEHKCVFIHIPKCAGTSIEKALGHLEGHKGRGGQDHRSIRMIQRPWVCREAFSSKENILEVLHRGRHRCFPSENERNKQRVSCAQYESYYKFTVVRNPWARAYSWYENVMRDEHHKKRLSITGHPSLNEFLRRYLGKGLLRSQLYWIQDFNGAIPLDYIGRFETLREDFEVVVKTLGLDHISLPRMIKGSGKSYVEEYDDEGRQLVRQTFGEEIGLFGYPFSS